MRVPIPDSPYAGGCLCGEVRFRYTARPLGLNACHCADCKRLSGADYIKMILGERGAFSLEKGKTRVWRKRADSGREIDIVRCAGCGTRLWHEPLASPHLLFVSAGALDDSRWAIPSSHIWIERAAPGSLVPGDALLVEGQPANRQVLFDAFRQVYG
jgi:hypothetical protein